MGGGRKVEASSSWGAGESHYPKPKYETTSSMDMLRASGKLPTASSQHSFSNPPFEDWNQVAKSCQCIFVRPRPQLIIVALASMPGPRFLWGSPRQPRFERELSRDFLRPSDGQGHLLSGAGGLRPRGAHGWDLRPARRRGGRHLSLSPRRTLPTRAPRMPSSHRTFLRRCYASPSHPPSLRPRPKRAPPPRCRNPPPGHEKGRELHATIHLRAAVAHQLRAHGGGAADGVPGGG